MSHFRRNAGRFSTHTATEAYQRQLATPVHKWKKAWISPTGLQPESSYKICKWIRVPKDELDEPEEDVNEDGLSQAGDEDEDMENGDENEGEDDEAGDEAGDGDEEGEDEVKETETPANGPASEAPPQTSAPVPEETLPSSTMEPTTVSASTLVPTSSVIAPTEATGTEGEDANAASALIGSTTTHPTEIPGNAIEISNVAPGHTETGAGDLGGIGAGVEMHVAEPRSGDVDMLGLGLPEAAEQPTAAETVTPMIDEGLVHGEMDQPKDMDDGAPPPEVEKT